MKAETFQDDLCAMECGDSLVYAALFPGQRGIDENLFDMCLSAFKKMVDMPVAFFIPFPEMTG